MAGFSLKWVTLYHIQKDILLTFRFCFKRNDKQNHPTNILRVFATGREIVVCVWDFTLVIIDFILLTTQRGDMGRNRINMRAHTYIVHVGIYLGAGPVCSVQCVGGRCRQLFLSDRHVSSHFLSVEKYEVKQPAVPSGAIQLLPLVGILETCQAPSTPASSATTGLWFCFCFVWFLNLCG